jgi:16S rRNA processing protein RimM
VNLGLPRYSYRIGRVLRAHGLSGDVIVQLFRPRALSEKRIRAKHPQPVLVSERELALEWAQAIGPDRAIVHLTGIADRDAAEALEGAYLDVDPKQLPALLTDEIDRLFGLEAIDTEGRPIGPILDIRDNGAQALLVIGEKEILVPAPFVRELRGDQVVIDAPEGLLDLND